MRKKIISLIILSLLSGMAIAESVNNKLTVDVAWNGMSFQIDRPQGAQEGEYGGMHYTISGLVYKAGVFTPDVCGLVSNCGWELSDDGRLEPQFDDQLIGRITSSGWFITSDYVDAMISALVIGDIGSFISAYEQNLGKITSKVSSVIEFGQNNTMLSNRIIIVDGMIGTILPEEKLTLVMTGSSGFRNHGRDKTVKMEMKALLNASGAQSFSLELPVGSSF